MNDDLDARAQTIADAVQKFGGKRAAARELGIDRKSIDRALARLARLQPIGSEVEIEDAPPIGETIAELLERRKRLIERQREHAKWESLIPVQVKLNGPICVTMIGDPHVDDDGCDLNALERDLSTIRRTPGMFAGHVGDVTNNWVGRLARLYAHQSTTFADALRLTEWMIEQAPPLFLVGGNHDCWGEGMDLLRFISKQHRTGPVQAHGVRMALRFPAGDEIRINARHDFPGRSQFSTTHGMKRATLFDHRDHIYVAGHLHTDEARIEPAIDGDVHWMFRVSGYKVFDEYPKQLGLPDKRLAPSVALVIDPTARIPAEKIKPFWCVEQAAEFLTWKRRRAA